MAEQARIREAGVEDLPAIYEVWYRTEAEGDAAPAPPGDTAWFAHVLDEGRVVVAEDDEGLLVGFAGVRRAGQVTVLTDLFVRPDGQGGGTGAALLDAVLPGDGPTATFASADRRALALYLRRGLRAWWPCYYLAGDPDAGDRLTAGEAVEARAGAGAGGLGSIPADEARYWLGRHRATLLVLPSGADVALVTLPSLHLLGHETAAAVVATSAAAPDRALDLVIATARWAFAADAPEVRLQVPGLHPALPALLRAGFRITDVDTCCATAPDLVLDPTCTTFFGDALVAP